MTPKKMKKRLEDVRSWRDLRPIIQNLRVRFFNDDMARVLNDYCNHQKKDCHSENEIDLIEDLQILILQKSSAYKSYLLDKQKHLPTHFREEPEMEPSDCVQLTFDKIRGFGHLVRETERELIRLALLEANHNRTNTAKLLGISIRTLRNKLNLYRELGFYE